MVGIRTTWIDPLPTTSPNVPLGTTSFPVHPISNMPVATIPSVLIIPGRLSHERLIHAIKGISQHWPNLFGRYERAEQPDPTHGGHYLIRFSQSPVRLESQEITLDENQPNPFPNNDVIQPTSSIYTPTLPADYYLPNSDSPLFAVRLTTILPANTSVLGVTVGHILADASSVNKILHDLSNAYQDLPLSAPPTFAPHINVRYEEPTEESLREFDMCVSTPKTMSAVMAEYSRYGQGSERVVLRFTKSEVASLTNMTESEEQLSIMDVISGWWIHLMERATGKVDSLLYTINYRRFFPNHPDFPPNLPTLSANVVQMRKIGITQNINNGKNKVQAIATAIRAEIDELRSEAGRVRDWLSVIAWRYESAAREGKTFVFVPPEGQVVINSNLRYNWVATFGFPFDQCSFHTSFSGSRFLRVFEANPELGQAVGETGVELVFNIPSQAVSTLSDLVAKDRERWSRF